MLLTKKARKQQKNPPSSLSLSKPTSFLARGWALPAEAGISFFQLTVGAMMMQVAEGEPVQNLVTQQGQRVASGGHTGISSVCHDTESPCKTPSYPACGSGLTWTQVKWQQPCLACSIYKGCISLLDAERLLKGWKTERREARAFKSHLLICPDLNCISEADKFSFFTECSLLLTSFFFFFFFRKYDHAHETQWFQEHPGAGRSLCLFREDAEAAGTFTRFS